MAFLNPSAVLGTLELENDFVAADFGSGSGGWVIPLAKRLKRGTVYAIDVLEEPLSVLRSKIKSENISNIKIIKSDVENTSTLQSNSCDLVLMTNLLFGVEDIDKVIEEGIKVLKKEGRLLIVDWKEDSPLGPGIKISAEEIKKNTEKAGLKLVKEVDCGIYHWGLFLVK